MDHAPGRVHLKLGLRQKAPRDFHAAVARDDHVAAGVQRFGSAHRPPRAVNLELRVAPHVLGQLHACASEKAHVAGADQVVRHGQDAARRSGGQRLARGKALLED